MNKNLPSLVLVALLALGLSTTCPAAAPNIYDQVQTFENSTATGSITAGNHNTQGGYTGTPLPDSFSYGGLTLNLDGSANYGLLHSHVFVDASSSPSTFQYGTAVVDQRVDDMLTISAPGMDGQTGTLNVRTLLNASVSNSGQSFEFYYSFAVNAAAIAGDYGYTGLLPLTFNNEAFTLSTPFTFGTPFGLVMGLKQRGTVSVSSGNSGFHHGDATATWDGAYTSVVDSLSAPVTNFTITSASGYNYAQPAPEPSSTLLSAFGGLAMLYRWRRAASRCM